MAFLFYTKRPEALKKKPADVAVCCAVLQIVAFHKQLTGESNKSISARFSDSTSAEPGPQDWNGEDYFTRSGCLARNSFHVRGPEDVDGRCDS